MATEQTTEIKEISLLIQRYLQENPTASDTVEGIAQWWLKRYRRNISLENVQCAMDLLEALGIVKKQIYASKIHYQKQD